jgi:hypothetical protein
MYLYAPPFHTIQDELDDPRHALSPEENALQDIVPSRTVPIADFGLGSDTAVALDYRHSTTNPSIIRLEWRLPAAQNRWLWVAPSFGAFWSMLLEGDHA